MGKRIKHKNKGYADASEPVYDRETFLYYFENRLKELIREEVKSHFSQMYWGAPF